MVHKTVGSVEMALVVTHRRRCLMVHNHINAPLFGVLMNSLHIEIRVGRNEIIYIIFLIAKPIFPADVPTLYEHAIEAVFGSKIDVTLHVGGVGTMPPMRLHFRIIGLANLHGGQVGGVRPLTHSVDHLPPNAYVFTRPNPRGIGYLTRLVEIEGQTRGEQLTCIIDHGDGAPWRHTRRLQMSLIALGIGGEMRGEHRMR